MGPGKVVLAPQLLWWGARGPSVALTTPMNLSGSGHLKTKVPMVRLWHSNVSAPSARKFIFELIFLLEKCAPAAHICVFSKPVSVTPVLGVLCAERSWHIGSEHRVALSGCGATSGTDRRGLGAVWPSLFVALHVVMISRMGVHSQIQGP